MRKFAFASVRGSDFYAYGVDVKDAWLNLCEDERDSGRIWRCFDECRNQFAVKNQGFSWYGDVVYK